MEVGRGEEAYLVINNFMYVSWSMTVHEIICNMIRKRHSSKTGLDTFPRFKRLGVKLAKYVEYMYTYQYIFLTKIALCSVGTINYLINGINSACLLHTIRLHVISLYIYLHTAQN